MNSTSALQDVAVVLLHYGDPQRTVRAAERVRALYPAADAPKLWVIENGSLAVGIRQRADISCVTLPRNVGYGAACNRGLRLARATGAELVVLLNNDVVLESGLLEAMRAKAADHLVGLIGVPLRETAGVVYGGGRVAWGRLRATLAQSPSAPDTLAYIHGACLGITRRCMDLVGPLREDLFLYWEDVEYGIRARRAGLELRVIGAPVLTHADSSALGRASPVRTYYLVRNAVLCARDHAPRLLFWWARALLPLRWLVARARGKRAVARALADAVRGVTGPAPETI